jgi:Restriction endonuclease
VKDGGRDAVLKKGTDTFLLECKKYSEGGLSGRPDLQKFHSAIMTAGAVRGFFVTCGAFTKDAMDFSATVPIELIDASKLLRYMFESKPAASRGPFDRQDLFDKPADASNPASAQDDVYSSMCQNCGDIVEHRLRTPQVATCRHGHQIEPTLDLESVLAAAGASPNCELCGSPMRLVNWEGRRFWGCVRYPSCRSTRNWIRPR